MISGTIVPELVSIIEKIIGGKMNLNPLKKDDNTDALVKALEDANAADNTAPNPVLAQTQTTPSPDGAAIAADPQVMSAGTTAPSPDLNAVAKDLTATTPMSDFSAPSPEKKVESKQSDSATGIAFSGNDLPSGISVDADAHLPVSPVKPSEGSGDNGELDTVKNSALEQLRPLIEKLDLEPADKFDKYLMMLRASDDPALIKPAFNAAQGIEGEKEKAQALLDIINEINYITASKSQ